LAESRICIKKPGYAKVSKGLPLGSTLASASPSEFKLAEKTLETVKVPRNGPGRPKKRPLRLIADKGYDSDPL
jgi:hypothetical protein